MDKIAIKSLIDSDQEASSLANIGDDNGCAKRLMEIANKVNRLVPNSEIKKQAILEGYWAGIRLAKDNINLPDSVRGLAISLIDWIDDPSGKNSSVDFSLAGVQQLLSGSVSATLLTQEQADSLISLSQVSPKITSSMVSEAMEVARPNGKVGE